ncbi:MAG: acetyl-CoA C-acetyltransferase [Clostridiales bacterium]|mgnify:CR=1 FL=1|jgi:acetyl-CoA C-acetyltransferase|nr:acetyl-CoA C-acetyltransferase [Clostridiales bacterium]
MRDVVIVEACRTAVGKIGGTLKDIPAEELARVVVQGILDRSKIDPKDINEVMMGHCRQTSDNPNIARIVALRCGIPEEVPAKTIMRQCASAMTAVVDGVMSIQVEDNDVVLAGGTESMSTAVFYIRGARYGLGTGNTTLVDSLTEGQFQSQPQEIYGSYNMGVTADNVAAKLNISREDADAFALQSQLRAAKAIKEGKFKDEIVPVIVPQRKKDPIVFDTDEFPRETSMEKLAKLKPAFTKDGITTAGNSSGRNDGASALLIMSADKAKELGLKPLARFVSYATTGLDPRIMGLGPVEATKKALKRANLTLDDIELIELNEAFAAQSIGCIRELGIEDKMDIINVNGGAIALGHPVGSSGCRIIVTLLNEMRRRGNKYGLATLCVAGGMGQAVIIEALY